MSLYQILMYGCSTVVSVDLLFLFTIVQYVHTYYYILNLQSIMFGVKIILQWNLFIKDTLGPVNSSTVERLSTLQRWKMY